MAVPVGGGRPCPQSSPTGDRSAAQVAGAALQHLIESLGLNDVETLTVKASPLPGHALVEVHPWPYGTAQQWLVPITAEALAVPGGSGS